MNEFHAPTRWWPARQRIAALAVLVATVTGIAGAAQGTDVQNLLGALAFIGATVAALVYPAAIAVQVIAGMLLVANILLYDGANPFLIAPLVIGIVAAAELLALVARLDSPLEREPHLDLRRAGVACLTGGIVFAAVLLVGALPGPAGLLALVLASASCILLAMLLASGPRPGGGRDRAHRWTRGKENDEQTGQPVRELQRRR